jgi:hypothetical protein
MAANVSVYYSGTKQTVSLRVTADMLCANLADFIYGTFNITRNFVFDVDVKDWSYINLQSPDNLRKTVFNSGENSLWHLFAFC